MSRGFDPSARNYRFVALTPSGMVVGLTNGQVASPSCGRLAATIPYTVLRPYLSALGQKLVSGVRRPK